VIHNTQRIFFCRKNTACIGSSLFRSRIVETSVSKDDVAYFSRCSDTVLGRQWSRRDVDFFIPQQLMFVEFKMFWLQKESVVT